MEISIEQRKQETNRITLWGVAVNLVLAIIKTLGGIFGQSQALLADGIHSLSDLASDAMVLIAAKHAGEDADEDHPYGHGRYETLATVALGVLLMGVAGGIAYDAILRLEHPDEIAIPVPLELPKHGRHRRLILRLVVLEDLDVFRRVPLGLNLLPRPHGASRCPSVLTGPHGPVLPIKGDTVRRLAPEL